MKKNTIILSICISAMVGLISINVALSSPIEMENYHYQMTQPSYQKNTLDYTDISASDVWDLLSSTDNGITLPIDVRTDTEWNDERIDTPYPEFPRHFEKNNIVDSIGYEQFIQLYNGSDVIVYCKVGGRSTTAAQVLSDRGFNGTIYNMIGGINAWKDGGFPTKLGNNPPDTPSTPVGPLVCNINTSYDFSSQSQDIDDDILRYGVDWNADSIIDDWTDYAPSGTEVTISLSWNTTGTFNLAFLAEDHVGDISDFSPPLSIRINTPPTPPIIDGPLRGKPGENYSYNIVSEDLENDELSYYIDWDDGNVTGWTRTLPAGDLLTVTHIWGDTNTYIIKVKAMDQWDAESDLTTLEVSMPYSIQFHHLHQFIMNHPFMRMIFLNS